MDQKKKKSKNIIKVLFVFLAILVLALVGAIVYFSLSEDFFKPEEEEMITCACYYIDPQVTTSCSDPKRAFKFNTAKGTLDDCSASCLLADLSIEDLYTTTKQEDFLTCTTKSVDNTKCSAMEITTENGLIVTGKIAPGEKIIATATFDSEEYTDYNFLINSIPTEPDSIEGNRITKNISDIGDDVTSLQISAQATDDAGDLITSILCNRLIEISTTANAGVNELILDTFTESGEFKIRSAIINASGLSDVSTSVIFTFKDETLTMTDGLDIDPERGRLSITQTELYDTSNFTEDNSLSLLNEYTGEIQITAELIQDEESLGSASATIVIEEEIVDDTTDDDADIIDDNTDDDTTDDDTTDDDTDSVDDDTDDDTAVDDTTDDDADINDDDVTASSFSVTNTSSRTCVERVSPRNKTTFIISIKNNSQVVDTIESVKNKLPLGFMYVSQSSQLNGNPIADSVFVTTTNIGSTQEVVWEPQDSWSVGANGTLTISFEASAGVNTLNGTNLNEVLVTPTEIPSDPNTLRSSKEITVAQVCGDDTTTDDDQDDSTPQTGVFDSTIGRITVGILIIIIGILMYNSNQGNQVAQLIVNSKSYRGAEMTSYKIFKPKKYFEEKILERKERE